MSPVLVFMARYPGGFDDEKLWKRGDVPKHRGLVGVAIAVLIWGNGE